MNQNGLNIEKQEDETMKSLSLIGEIFRHMNTLRRKLTSTGNYGAFSDDKRKALKFAMTYAS